MSDIRPGQRNPSPNVLITDEEALALLAENPNSKRAKRHFAVKAVAEAAYATGLIDPLSVRFEEDVLLLTMDFIRREREDLLPTHLQGLNFESQLQISGHDRKANQSRNLWAASVRRQWPVKIEVKLPTAFPITKSRKRLKDRKEFQESRPAPEPPRSPDSPPAVRQSSRQSGRITRIVSEKVSVITIVTDNPYQAPEVGKIVSDMLALAGITNELQQVLGSGTFVDLKIKHSAYASELSDLVRFYRDKASWILDAMVRPAEYFGEPRLGGFEDEIPLFPRNEPELLLTVA